MDTILLVVLLCAALSVPLLVMRARGIASNGTIKMLSALVDESNDPLLVIDLANGRILRANARSAAMLGYTIEQLREKGVFQLYHPSTLHLCEMRMAEAWEKNGAVFEDLPLMHANGHEMEVGTSMRVCEYDKRPAIVLQVRDIAERLALQRQISDEREVLRLKNAEVNESIRYAQRIQQAVIPEPASLTELLPEAFIMYRPKDILSGDLYWFGRVEGHIVLATADCTGHGIPGALLSMMGTTFLKDAVLFKNTLDPADILGHVRQDILHSLGRSDEGAGLNDGMDASVVVLAEDLSELRFAGANGTLCWVRGGEISVVKGDRAPLGISPLPFEPFTTHTISLQNGDRFYLLSDGLQDQFGGPNGKKLGSKGLRQWLVETSELSLDDQHQAISDRFRMWKGSLEQVDDVVLVGVEV